MLELEAQFDWYSFAVIGWNIEYSIKLNASPWLMRDLKWGRFESKILGESRIFSSNHWMHS